MSQPNIVVIMADQMRWDALGISGNDHIRTPHLDRLAVGGAYLQNAFVPIPLCTPSRRSLFTGRYPDRGSRNSEQGYPMPVGTPNLARALREAGYRTMLVGKDHLFGPESLERCFDHAVRYDHSGRVPGDGGDVAEEAVRAGRHGRYDEWYFEQPDHDAGDSPTRRLTTAAIDAVRDAGTRDQPFFLWLSYPDPHPPYVVAEPYASLYRGADVGTPATAPNELDDKPLRQRLSRRLMRTEAYSPADLQRIREIYYGMVSFIDDEVGRFVQSLDEMGLRDDTIIVFMSDHGDYLGDHGMVRKSPSMYDCLVRIPLFINWPGEIPPSRPSGTLVESIDLASTLLEVAGVAGLPGDEGTSLVPLLRGQVHAHKDRVFGHYGSDGAPCTEADLAEIDVAALMSRPHPWISELTMRGRMAMVRTLDWKLVGYRGGEGELYDLRRDPDELVNRYGDPECAAIRADLAASLVDFLLDTSSRPPEPVPTP